MLKDQYGTNLNIGDFITYPQRAGSSIWMNTAMILEFGEYEDSWSNEKYPNLKVEILEESWARGLKPGERIPVSRKATLTRLDRLTKIDNALVIERLREHVAKSIKNNTL